MIIALMLLTLSNPWQGVWRIITPEQPEKATHLSVSEEGEIQYYDPQWAPYEVIRSEFADRRFVVEAVEQDGFRPFVVEGTRQGEQLTGTIRLQMPQWLYEAEFSAVRVHSAPFPSPPEWVLKHRRNDFIDVSHYLRQNAPLGSLEKFLAFWEEQVEPEFYIFLDKIFYGPDNNVTRKAELLEELYQNLSAPALSSKPSPVESRTSAQALEREPQAEERGTAVETAGTASPESARPAATVMVRIPLLEGLQESVLRLATIRNDYGEDVKICCGRKRYTMETFQLQPVPLSQ